MEDHIESLFDLETENSENSDHKEELEPDFIEIKEYETIFSHEIEKIRENRIKKSKPRNQLTPEILMNHFHLPKNEAFRLLRTAERTLDAALKKHGMCNWPYRKIKKSENIIRNLEMSLTNPGNSLNQKRSEHMLKEERIRLSSLKKGIDYQTEPFLYSNEFDITYQTNIAEFPQDPQKIESVKMIFFFIHNLFPSSKTNRKEQLEEELNNAKLYYLNYLGSE